MEKHNTEDKASILLTRECLLKGEVVRLDLNSFEGSSEICLNSHILIAKTIEIVELE